MGEGLWKRKEIEGFRKRWVEEKERLGLRKREEGEVTVAMDMDWESCSEGETRVFFFLVWLGK